MATLNGETKLADDIKQKIADWLKKQGYPLEMEVANAFRHAGFEVSNSEYYIDQQEQKPREIDVLASLSTTDAGILFQVTYVVECKSAKDSPWICFPSHNRARESSVGFLARIATREGRRALVELSVNPDVTTSRLLGLPEHHAYGITNALKDNNKDIPYGALRAARSAAQALVAYSDETQKSPEKIGYVCIALPLVVTNAPLFTVSLKADGELDIASVDHENILRTGFDTEYSVVEVVTASALPAYIDSRGELISNFLRRLPGRIPNTMLEIGYANEADSRD